MNITQHNTEISNERPAVDAQNPVASGDRRRRYDAPIDHAQGAEKMTTRTQSTTLSGIKVNPYAWTKPHSGNTTAKGFRAFVDCIRYEVLPLRVLFIENRSTVFKYWHITGTSSKGFTIQVAKHIGTATLIPWPKKSEITYGTDGFSFNGFTFEVDPDATLDGRDIPVDGMKLGDGTEHEDQYCESCRSYVDHVTVEYRGTKRCRTCHDTQRRQAFEYKGEQHPSYADLTSSAAPCDCTSDPYTWIIDDLGTMTICFGCRTCGAAWTRIAPEPMQRLHRRRMEAQAKTELEKMGWTA